MKLRTSLLPLALLLPAFGLQAQEALPRLELGIGLFALEQPVYRGSRESQSYLLPAPYIKYRGDRLRVDEGANGVIFESPDVLFTLSGNLSLPADEDTPERAGMDELAAIVELGPSLNYRFKRFQRSELWLDLPLRFAFTVDSDLDHVGQVFQPRLSWRKPATRLGEWKLRINFGPIYFSDAYHDYYYSVGAADATPERPEYDAPGGFSGYRAEFTYSKRIGRFWLGGFLRYDDLSDAKIDDSPLVSETNAWTGGIAWVWVFYEDR